MKHFKQVSKRCLAMLLTFIMAMGLLQTTAFARVIDKTINIRGATSKGNAQYTQNTYQVVLRDEFNNKTNWTVPAAGAYFSLGGCTQFDYAMVTTGGYTHQGKQTGLPISVEVYSGGTVTYYFKERTHYSSDYSQVERTDPTCYAAGSIVKKCPRCGKVGSTETIPKLEADYTGQSWYSWNGQERMDCKNCGGNAPGHYQTRPVSTVDYTYQLTWDYNGGTVGSDFSRTKTETTQVNTHTFYEDANNYGSPRPERSGFTFNGWNYSGNGSFNSSNGQINMTGTANGTVSGTLTAQWQQIAEKVTLTYDANGGINPPTAQTVDKGGNVTIKNKQGMTHPNGLEFLGWSENKDATTPDLAWSSYGDVVSLTTNTTLYAVWKQNAPTEPGTKSGNFTVAKSFAGLANGVEGPRVTLTYEAYRTKDGTMVGTPETGNVTLTKQSDGTYSGTITPTVWNIDTNVGTSAYLPEDVRDRYKNVIVISEDLSTATVENYTHASFGPFYPADGTASNNTVTFTLDGATFQKDLRVKNTYTKNSVVPDPNPKLTSITKKLVGTAPTSVKVGDDVTLEYKIIVTGGEGAKYTVTDDATLKDGSAWSGTLDSTGRAEIHVTKTVTAQEKGTLTVTNTAYVKPGEGTDPIDPNDPDTGHPSNEVTTNITVNEPNPDPEKTTVRIKKDFTGITSADIPSDFQLNWTYGNEGGTLKTSDVTPSNNGLTYTWAIEFTKVDDTTLKLTESGADITGKTLTTTAEANKDWIDATLNGTPVTKPAASEQPSTSGASDNSDNGISAHYDVEDSASSSATVVLPAAPFVTITNAYTDSSSTDPSYQLSVDKQMGTKFTDANGDRIVPFTVTVENTGETSLYNLMLVDTMDKTLEAVDDMATVNVTVTGNDNTAVEFKGVTTPKAPVRDNAGHIVWNSEGGVDRDPNGEEKWDFTWTLAGEFKPGAKVTLTYNAKVIYPENSNSVVYYNYADAIAGTEITDVPKYARSFVSGGSGSVGSGSGPVGGEEVKYTLTYDFTGGKWNDKDTHTVEVWSDKQFHKFTLDNAVQPTKADSEFTKTWTDSDGFTINPNNIYATVENPNVTIYAKWKSTSTVTVTFDPNGGNWNGSTVNRTKAPDKDTKKVEEETAPTQDNQVFDGWYTAVDGGDKVDFATRTFETDTTLYAHWTPAPPETTEYTITVKYQDADGKEIKTSETVTTTNGGTYDVTGKKVDITGYTFKEVKDNTALFGTVSADTEIVLVYTKNPDTPDPADATYKVVHAYYTNGSLTGSTESTISGKKVGDTVSASDITKVTTYGGNTYAFTSFDKTLPYTLVDGTNVITLRYDRTYTPPYIPTYANYTVEWRDARTGALLPVSVKNPNTVTRSAILNSTVSVTDNDKQINGYTFSGSDTRNVESASLGTSGTVLRLYFTKNSYTGSLEVTKTASNARVVDGTQYVDFTITLTSHLSGPQYFIRLRDVMQKGLSFVTDGSALAVVNADGSRSAVTYTFNGGAYQCADSISGITGSNVADGHGNLNEQNTEATMLIELAAGSYFNTGDTLQVTYTAQLDDDVTITDATRLYNHVYATTWDAQG